MTYMNRTDMLSRNYREILSWTFILLAAVMTLPFHVSLSCGQQHTGDTCNSPALDLETALETALASNPSIKQVHSTHDSAKAGVGAAMSAFMPKLDVDFSLGRSNNPVFAFGSKLNQASFTMQDFELDRLNDPDYRTNWNTRFVLTQPLFNRGREYTGYRISRAGEKMAAMQEVAVRQAVFFNVEQAYFQVLLAKEAMEAMRLAVRTAVEHEKLAGRRYKAGLVLKSDVLSATVHRTGMERQLLDVENRFHVAMAVLNQAMGVSQDTQWCLEPVYVQSVSTTRDIKAWLEIAMERRPELKMSRKKIEVADYKKQGAQMNFLPSLNFHGIYEQNTDNLARFGGDSWTFMATASFNIFNGLGDSAGFIAASAEKNAAREAMRETRNRMELEVRRAYYGFQTALKQLEVTKAAVEQAGESVRILKNRYDSGMALMVELLAADTMFKDQQLQQARARFDALTALARLKLSAGVLGTSVSDTASGHDETRDPCKDNWKKVLDSEKTEN